MVFHCCVPNCKPSGFDENVSLHKFPDVEKQIKAWRDRIRSGSSVIKADFIISSRTRVCSNHFKADDFVNPESAKKPLKPEAVPANFTWTQRTKRRSPRKRLNVDTDETDTASEGEDRVHVDVQTDIPVPCAHRLHSNPKLNLLRFFTGFATISIFTSVLELIIPKKDRSLITYWDRRRSRSYTCGAEYFDSDSESSDSDSDDDDDDAFK